MEEKEEDNFYAFLRSRGFQEDLISYLIEEKIDGPAYLIMFKNDSPDLAKLFPKFGDRYAILNFCQKKESSLTKRKQSLIEKLKSKVKKDLVKNKDEPRKKSATFSLDDSSSDGDEIFLPKQSTSLRSKITRKTSDHRKIEIGWVCQKGSSLSLTQVRTKQGGGTRKLTLSKKATKIKILNEALNMFFPGGTNLYGKVEEYDHDIFDFKQNILPDDITVEQMYESTGLTMLRFYLSSVKKQKPVHPQSERLEVEEENITNKIEQYLTPSYNSLEEDTSFNIISHLEDNSNEEEPNSNVIQQRVTPSPSYNLSEEVTFIDPSSHLEATSDEQLLAYDITLDKTNQTKLIIHRGRVIHELIEAFQHIKTFERVEVEMILPNGQPERALDSGGVLRDCLGEFWTSFYDQYTEGTTLKIPIITQEFKEEQWTAIAKIIKIGWEQEKYFPIKIVPTLFQQCFYKNITSDLVTVFLKCLGAHECKIIEDAIVNFFSVDEDDLIEVFSNLKSKRKPSKDNIAPLLYEIAHRELVQKPFFITECWAPVLNNLMPESTFKALRQKMLPTSKNILEKLYSSEDNASIGNKAVFNFLKKFIREADEHILTSFVRFCTGADILTEGYITVSFNNSSGFSRSPVGHVCGRTLELPNTYDNFVEFRKEFTSILSSGIWVMDLI